MKLTLRFIIYFTLGAAAFFVVRYFGNKEAQLISAIEREQEVREIKAANKILVLEADKSALETALKHVMTTELAVALEATKKVIPKSKIVRAVEACTAPLPLERESIDKLCKDYAHDTSVDITGEVRVTEAYVKSEKGITVVDGVAECWRVNPTAKLFGGPYLAQKTTVVELAQPPPAQCTPWYISSAIGCGACFVGAAALKLVK
ncbi:MAG: hypothetical protein QXN55_08785 [Candidatus Nitrosotenuis sp.]